MRTAMRGSATPATGAAATVLAGVWLWQGLWCKVLGRRADHEAIVAAVPRLDPGRARAATVAIGAAESVLAGWVLSRRAPRLAAVTQTATLAAMNAGGLAFAAERIPRPKAMLLRNSGLLAAAWAVARWGRAR